jgi:SEC-C motif-containing protein
MEPCPCGSGQTYEQCCMPIIKGDQPAQSAEALMRARYSAHVKSEIDFIVNSTHTSERGKVDRNRLVAWTKRSEWLGLEILSAEGGQEDKTGTVEFMARYREKGRRINHHELASFIQENGHWYFKDGQPPHTDPVVRSGPKIGRNDPCPCGSGKKYKKCCGA